MQVYVRENFLSPEDCEAAIACFPLPRAAAISRQQGDRVETDLRRSRVSFLVDSSGHTLVKRLRELLLDVNERVYHFEVAEIEPVQLAEYSVGEEYRDHLDIGAGRAALRKLSLSVQLTDPAAYDGGNLVIWRTGTVERSRGAAVVFPSYLVHKVEPVTRGLRRSLVAWMNGVVPFR